MAVTTDQVRQIAKLPPVEKLPDENVQNYVNAAEVVIGDLAGKGLDADRLELIELYLAAHFAVLSEEFGGLAAQTIGTSEERYQNDLGVNSGLATTRFGRQAIALDPTGTLATQAAKPLKAEFRVV